MYNYNEEKTKVFTEANQTTFLKIRDNVQRLLKESGAVTMDKAISKVGGDTWFLMACVDRLVELNEIREVPTNYAGQHRVFTSINN
jgi:hypothetical protein